MADDDRRPVPLRQVIGSILAAFLGVQSSRNRERDFTRGSARQYIGLGLVATVLFVLLVYAAVRLILAVAVP